MSDPANALGIIMLDTAFERPVGDVGNAKSWPFPVLYRKVSGATARTVVAGRDESLLEAFVEAGEELQRQGARALTTSCGFLVLRQSLLASRLSLPVATSSLMQIPLVMRCLPAGKRVGVVTYERSSLTPAHFSEAGADPETPTVGLPKEGYFHGLIERGEAYDWGNLEMELTGGVQDLLAREADIGAIVFECTNLPPFSGAIARRFGLPVFDILTLGRWLFAGTQAG
ncbi:aspartate/glutamate racemase family protein [Agrobacterium rhizogenes]|uniref:aspartate/glutamate racemase family protein n=1 Tax=Rhizobium rhizogenes TaxID=359 RepID=UPI00115DB426|nr:aspartate/glutamate racemase family protein [Rhizobium rhizogenes]KAA6486217.1 aspartate/glutamate racemase family protein [Agrobacterium sp. ICMP 7243]NTF50677.1 aspartate/glutamate racemase family protein [Rhizobium rhizogenes]NTF63733.1 aspartate/glutamate racemase family protein [Rhizobium rhizogenes]NTG02664.1 aspartate/glutamate racemase family protein [Rhizobium rhizogenes]NTG09729.1 aspartate/glutamate racemase family protein [Rhizobium rhizogenes]